MLTWLRGRSSGTSMKVNHRKPATTSADPSWLPISPEYYRDATAYRMLGTRTRWCFEFQLSTRRRTRLQQWIIWWWWRRSEDLHSQKEFIPLISASASITQRKVMQKSLCTIEIWQFWLTVVKKPCQCSSQQQNVVEHMDLAFSMMMVA